MRVVLRIETLCACLLTCLQDASVSWPPPDPDRIPRKIASVDPDSAFIHSDYATTNKEHREAFRKRQEQDLKRYQVDTKPVYRRQPFHRRYEGSNTSDGDTGRTGGQLVSPSDGEEAWRNSEGDRLDDFGVDETVEFYDEDDIPLAELLSRRRTQGSANSGDQLGISRHHPAI